MEPVKWHEQIRAGFDLETTGRDPSKALIVTGTIVMVDGEGTARSSAEWLVDPGVPIPEEAAEVHGVTTAKAQAEGMPAAQGVAEILETLRDLFRAGVPVIAFNGVYDFTVMDREARRHGLEPLDPAPVIDPFVLDRQMDRFRKGKRTLTDLLAHYGIQQDGRLHTADVDVSATLDVLRAIVAAHPQVGASSLEDLHQQQITWHRSWAENFNEFLKKKGRTPDVNLDWPL